LASSSGLDFQAKKRASLEKYFSESFLNERDIFTACLKIIFIF
jgi:hypothetical protein